MIKVISFDIGGTLIKGVNNNHTMEEFSKITGCDYEKIKYAYRDMFQKRDGTFDELVSLFCQRLNIKETSEIKKFLFDNFNQESYFDMDVIPIIKKLKELGYKVILFSNNSPLYPDKINDEVKNMCDGFFYSYQMGHTKDEKEAYQYIEEKLGYHGNEIMHIGDSLESDYYYPKEFGWKALYYGDKDNIECINDLNEIFKYLEND